MEVKKQNAVRLLKNNIYPTYQLYAEMSNDKTPAEKGLAFAALTVLDWLKTRIGEDLPESLASAPDVSEYLTYDINDLKSIYINEGYVINIVSLPDSGMWSLQITEPDLGSNPGNAEQRRSAVAGRIIETNISFKITGNKLECGFKTLISDPEGTKDIAEVYRFAIIKKLAENKNFGLKHLLELNGELRKIDSKKRLDDFISLWKNRQNQLPIIVFTDPQKNRIPDFVSLGGMSHNIGLNIGNSSALIKDLIKEAKPVVPLKTDEKPDESFLAFAKSGIGYCHTFLLDFSLIKDFKAQTGKTVSDGQALFLEPACFGGKISYYGMGENEKEKEKNLNNLKAEVHNYLRFKETDFGNISFLSSTREALLRSAEELRNNILNSNESAKQRISEMEQKFKEELAKKDVEIDQYKGKLKNKDAEMQQAKDKADALVTGANAETEKIKTELLLKDEIIKYYKRKLDVPKKHTDIPEWANKHFADKLFFHAKAIDLLNKTAPDKADTGLICDALDYLATDYWNTLFGDMSEDTANDFCSKKYGRPFEVLPITEKTTQTFPAEYKIKYYKRQKDKPQESPLDRHLKVGNHSSNLLRIYFLVDKEKKLIVIGSLPEHLSTITFG